MSKRKTKSRRHAKPTPSAVRHSGETRAADAATVAWTVSVMMVLMCDLGAVIAHFYTASYFNARRMVLFKELILFAGAVIGFISLVLLPIMLKSRRTPPPTGITVFAACAALAPILALLVHSIR